MEVSGTLKENPEFSETLSVFRNHPEELRNL